MAVRSNQRATARNPCPCCGGTSRCLVYLPEIPTACLCCNPPPLLRNPKLEKPAGIFGRPFWVVFLASIDPTYRPVEVEEEANEVPRWENYATALETMHDMLIISPSWEDWLLRRGFLPQQIATCGYKSLPTDVGQLSSDLHDLYREHWSAIPGFRLTPAGYPRITGAGCLLIPIRDIAGKITGFQLRASAEQIEAGLPKYFWFSHGGLLPPLFHHIIRPNSSTLILTEGPLKADMVGTCWGSPSILSWQGVNSLVNLKQSLDLLQKLPITKAIIANDMDAWYHVAEAIGTASAKQALTS